MSDEADAHPSGSDGNKPDPAGAEAENADPYSPAAYAVDLLPLFLVPVLPDGDVLERSWLIDLHAHGAAQDPHMPGAIDVVLGPYQSVRSASRQVIPFHSKPIHVVA